MFWPRFKLTPQEEKKGVSKYFDHERGKRGVLRKMYSGQLTLNQNLRNPVFTFQIARRCRVFGLTASGDIPQFKVQIQDSSGEQYLAQPISLSALLGGYAELPPPAFKLIDSVATGGFPRTHVDGVANNPILGWPTNIGMPETYAPLIFEPNIVLDSNQVLNISGTPMTDYDSVNYRVDLVFHVWEFPSWQRTGPA